MGQNQSSEKSERSSSSRGGTPQADRERKVYRRISAQALSNPRPQPADVSASTVAAKGTTTHNLDTSNLEKMLQSTSPELASKSSRVERSTSRKKREAEPRMTPQTPLQTSQPVAMPGTATVGNIDIPTSATTTLPTRNRHEELRDNGKEYEDRTYVPVSHHRPPRLPLPIAEVQAPDSPTLAPVVKNDSDVPIFDTDDSGLPARRTSMLSLATQDEEDVGEELQPFGVGLSGQTVPYTIEWNRPAEKVFVTGTFAAWDKKYRLRKSDSDSGRFKTVINLPPGTHHLKFFVDNNMVTSPDLPTAVDFNNILVNYIEISTDDIPRPAARRESGQTQKLPPYQASPQYEVQDHTEQYSGTVTPGEDDSSQFSYIPFEEMPEGDFRQVTPQSLLDIDCPEDDPRYKQAAQVIQESAAPPSLPLFLSRSILNGNLPVKDDSSVLALPNHTVLNHLMTSNVRNGVLATSVTTRYKKKYVTTISFKPVPKSQSQAG